jgi:hypothetical protein
MHLIFSGAINELDPKTVGNGSFNELKHYLIEQYNKNPEEITS